MRFFGNGALKPRGLFATVPFTAQSDFGINHFTESLVVVAPLARVPVCDSSARWVDHGHNCSD